MSGSTNAKQLVVEKLYNQSRRPRNRHAGSFSKTEYVASLLSSRRYPSSPTRSPQCSWTCRRLSLLGPPPTLGPTCDSSMKSNIGHLFGATPTASCLSRKRLKHSE